MCIRDSTMMAVRYHGCTCHQRYQTSMNGSAGLSSSSSSSSSSNHSNSNGKDNNNGNGRDVVSAKDSEQQQQLEDVVKGDDKDSGEIRPQPWYFHVVASLILVVHGFTFLVPQDPESEDTDMVRTVAKWFGYEMDWIKQFTPYAQVMI